MTVTPAPSCKAALAEASRLWPKRSKASDGILPSAAHSLQNPTSDHELGNAFDLTHDPANGCDAHGLAEAIKARRDGRVKYVISNRRIWTPSISNQWRPYSGSNPHTKHMHVSIHATARNSTGLWFPQATPAPLPQLTPLQRRDSYEVDMVINSYTLGLTTDDEGRGWDKVPFPLSRIVGHTTPGLRPGADGRYLVGQVGFAEEDGGTVVSLTEWAPKSTAVIHLSVVN